MHSRLLIWFCLAGFLSGTGLATDVAYWTEYRPDKADAEQTYLLLQCAEGQVKTVGPVEKVEYLGGAKVVPGAWLNRGVRVDGRAGLRCVATNIFQGGRVSLEAWIKLERYPEKEGYVIYRAGSLAEGATERKERAKGFALVVDVQGTLHFDTINPSMYRRIRVSSPPGSVPLKQWVHVVGICSERRSVFVNGKQAGDRTINWGEGLQIQGEQETAPRAVYIGNNEELNAGIVGLIDQVRIHRNVHRFWAPKDDTWTDPAGRRQIPAKPPYFVAEHAATVHVPLDGTAAVAGSANAKVELGGNDFRPGVHGKGFAGKVTITASNLFREEEGSLEFWSRPLGINNLSDRNRTFVSEPFIFYLLNGGEREPTIYFTVPERGLHFVYARGEIHPARWYHWVVTWRDKEIRMYLDGVQVGGTMTQQLAPNGRKSANRFVFNGNETIQLLDEIRIYDRALLVNEVQNAFWRYRDPAKLAGNVRLPAQQVQVEYFPSERKLYYKSRPCMTGEDFKWVEFELRQTNSAVLRKWQRPWTQTAGELDLPELGEGVYTLANAALRANGEVVPGEAVSFYAWRFEWEKNELGITEEVFAPFTAVEVSGTKVSVVSRSMTLNNFGLWDEVVTLGRNILAGPMRVRFETEGGEGRWTNSSGHVVSQKATEVMFEGSCEAGAVKVETRSSIEVDGCMRVSMILLPGSTRAEIKKLWVEIPLKDSEVTLMHTVGDGLRHNYAGVVPPGNGRIWDGSMVKRTEPWRNAFVPYVWLGGPERGLAFFAENDKGWVTEKGKSKAPTHELVREGARLVLKVYLVNRPVTFKHSATVEETPPPEHLVVFGLQASPTKPMPADWRRKLPDIPGGLAVVPFGGIQCASQGPLGDDWSIVEKIVQARAGTKFDTQWMENYVKEHNPPKVHNVSDWTYFMNHFAQRAKDTGLNRALTVYQEEMRAAHSRPEWLVFQDEWKTVDGPALRTRPEGLDLRGGHRSFSGISEISFPRSYADFGTWMANEWLKRGVSLYWDNTYLYPCYNTRTSAAYLAEDGQIQPALIIWNVREYHKRVWNVMQQRRKERKEPLEWVLHMTNTELLPVHTWGTAQLDHELAVLRPFSPEWLRTETIGRQVGNFPLSLYEVYGRDNPVIKKLPKAQAERIEWGMRAVHEIQRSGPMERHLRSFGYGEDSVTVHNYWADEPVLAVKPATVKWLALTKNGEALVVLASWSEESVQANVNLDLRRLRLEGADGVRVIDAETGEELAKEVKEGISIEVSGPWGNRLLRVR